MAPALWLAHAVWVAREVTLRRAVRGGAAARGRSRCPVSAWWIAGLSVQGTNGIEILRYTETAQTVAAVSVSHEVLRGLGYWFFYGGDRLGPWIEPSIAYTQFLPLIAVTYLLPIAGLAGAVIARWRHRAYFVMLRGRRRGAGRRRLPVGRRPLGPGRGPSRRSSCPTSACRCAACPRAVPLVALGLAVLLGAGVTSVARRWPRWHRPRCRRRWSLVALLALPAAVAGPTSCPRTCGGPTTIPDYWQEAAAHLDAEGARHPRAGRARAATSPATAGATPSIPSCPA